jgi:DNA processing protein
LHRAPGIGPVKFKQCLLTDPDLVNLPTWLKPDWRAVDLDLQWQQQENCHILTLNDLSYPSLLKEIANPPPILFVQGDVKVLNKQQLAIVGTRYPSHQGIEMAYNFANYLVTLGFTITSGLALGIDTASHQGALANKTQGATVAVLGCGLDQIYPAQNKKLALEIIAHGAVISEFPLGVRPLPGNFPSRNRIISGLSLGVLIVEAALKSGALITAQLAGEQGREVFVLPGSIYNAKAKGCHQLIKQGAKLVESGADILEELNGLLRPEITKSCAPWQNKANISVKPPLANEHLELLSYINQQMISVDEVILQSGYPAYAVSSILMQLELDGYIVAVPGGYIRC